MGVPFPTIASNLLAFSSKMADVAAISTDKRSVTLSTTYNTRSVHAVTHRAQQNLRDFTAIRPCFQQLLSTTWTTTYRAAKSQQHQTTCCKRNRAMDDNVSRSNITTTSNNLLAIASARNTCYVAFQQIAGNGTEPMTSGIIVIMTHMDSNYGGPRRQIIVLKKLFYAINYEH